MKDKDLEKLQKMLENKIEAFEEKAEKELYQTIELRLTDNKGNVLIKGTMKVADMMVLESLQNIDKGEVMKMFYFALEDDLKNKILNESKQEDNLFNNDSKK